jgi:hypothetical protein
MEPFFWSFTDIDGSHLLPHFYMSNGVALEGDIDDVDIASGGKEEREANIRVYARLTLNWSKSSMVMDFQSILMGFVSSWKWP